MHARAAGQSSAGSVAVSDNLVGVHALVWAGGWTRDECERAVKGSALLEYDLVEVPLFDPASLDVQMTKSIFKEYGITPSASLGLHLDADVSSGDAEVAARGTELLVAAVKAASGIGSKYLVGVLHSAMAKYPQPFDWSGAGHRNLVHSLRHVADVAADEGVTVGLEVVNRYESNVLNTAKQAMALLSDLDRPNVVVHLDSYHMNIEEGNLSRAVETCGDKLGYFHVGESHRGYLGTGTIDWTVLFRALARAGYRGPLTFESFSSQVVSPDLSNNLCVWRNLWDDSEDLARRAREFIRAEWHAANSSLLDRS